MNELYLSIQFQSSILLVLFSFTFTTPSAPPAPPAPNGSFASIQDAALGCKPSLESGLGIFSSR